jgi:hypothetical protein
MRGALDIFNFDVHRNLLREIAVKSGTGTRDRASAGKRDAVPTGLRFVRHVTQHSAALRAGLSSSAPAALVFRYTYFAAAARRWSWLDQQLAGKAAPEPRTIIRHINTVNSFGKFGLTAKEQL